MTNLKKSLLELIEKSVCDPLYRCAGVADLDLLVAGVSLDEVIGIAREHGVFCYSWKSPLAKDTLIVIDESYEPEPTLSYTLHYDPAAPS